MGVSPHLLVQTAHEGHARLLGGWPPLPLGLGFCPILLPPSLHAVLWGCTLLGGSPLVVGFGLGAPPSLHAVRWECTLLRGCPLLFLLLLAPGDPLLLLGHSMRWKRTLPYTPPPFVWDQSARRRRARSVPFPLVCLDRGVPPLLVWHAMRWERMLPYRGVPPSPWLCPHDMGAHGPPPPPSCPRAVCVCGWGGGLSDSTWSLSVGGVPGLSARGLPPMPLMRASGARCWARGSPPPSLPLWPLTLGAGCRSGGPSSLSVLSWAPALLARAGDPLLVWWPPSWGGSPAGPLRGPTPLPRCAPCARAAGQGFPLSLPPLFGRSR